MGDGFLVDSLELPNRDVTEVLVIAQRFALFGLVLLAEVATAGLLAFEGVPTHEFGELEVVGDPSRLFEFLVEIGPVSGNLDVVPELCPQSSDLVNGIGEALARFATCRTHRA